MRYRGLTCRHDGGFTIRGKSVSSPTPAYGLAARRHDAISVAQEAPCGRQGATRVPRRGSTTAAGDRISGLRCPATSGRHHVGECRTEHAPVRSAHIARTGHLNRPPRGCAQCATRDDLDDTTASWRPPLHGFFDDPPTRASSQRSGPAGRTPHRRHRASTVRGMSAHSLPTSRAWRRLGSG